jgi:Flp pilus assembly pilin Flp
MTTSAVSSMAWLPIWSQTRASDSCAPGGLACPVRSSSTTTPMLRLLTRFVIEETGQDLIEYALLTAAIGLAGVAGINLISAAINGTYTSWDSGVNNLWEVPPPQ